MWFQKKANLKSEEYEELKKRIVSLEVEVDALRQRLRRKLTPKPAENEEEEKPKGFLSPNGLPI